MNQTDGTKAEALDALSHLLQVDLEDVRWHQEEAARAALLAKPSRWQLILAVKDWAKAVARVCRQRSGECAKLYAGEPDPAMQTTKTLLFVLCAHLQLPADPRLLLRPEAGDWPESNAVSGFVLRVTDTPTELLDGSLVEPTLPRWEPQGRFGRLIAGLEREPSREKFLSVEETRKHLRGLEESFRDVLWGGLESWRSEAVLATYRTLPLLPAQGNNRERRAGSAKHKTTSRSQWEDRVLAFKFLAIERRLRGNHYCEFLDKYEIRPSFDWTTRGCPRSFAEAYKADKWKRLIHQEKNRAKATMSKLREHNPVELRRILAIAQSKVSAVSARD